MTIQKSGQHIGLVGGTFDPVHYAHLVIAEEVRATLNLASMVFIPAGSPPHKQKQDCAPAHHRLAMLQLAISGNPHFSISHVEIERPGPSYLADTLRILREQWGPEQVLYFVLGWDSLTMLHTWHDPQGILAHLDYLVAVGRPGYSDEDETEYNKQLEARLPGITQRLLVVPVPQLEISSTDLRNRIATGRPIKYQLPEVVERYIADHRLYHAAQYQHTAHNHLNAAE
ncbi:MAG: nicotinate-nucleotide adenylyltransferase [Ktedonobacteraceae bacterium]|nr:nicotinate-nucleotide adenylyltransferase [Ktedonobacteraceae bacterium]